MEVLNKIKIVCVLAGYFYKIRDFLFLRKSLLVNAEGTHSIYFLNLYFILYPYTKAVTQSDEKIELNKIKNN